MRVILIIGVECVPLEIGQRDSERHISKYGNCQAADAASFLNILGVLPKIILTSPFLRTQETGRCLAEKISGNCSVEPVPALMPGAGPDEIMQAITQRSSDCSDQEWTAVVIHEPDADFIIRNLIGQEYTVPINSGMVVGLELACAHGKVTGKLLFTRYPGEI